MRVAEETPENMLPLWEHKLSSQYRDECDHAAHQILAIAHQLLKERDAALLVARLAIEGMPRPSLEEIRRAFDLLDKVR